jgi:Leucine-rich repeat (LRR) protein
MTKEQLLAKIQYFKYKQSFSLSLEGLGLTELPPEIGQLITLRELVLRNNQLSNLPPEIGQLTILQRLDLYDNQLTNLPPEIGKLTALQ